MQAAFFGGIGCASYAGDIAKRRLLVARRILDLQKKTRFDQASTAEVYGLQQELPQRETTPSYLRSPNAVAKIYPCGITANHRSLAGEHIAEKETARDSPRVCGIGQTDEIPPQALRASHRFNSSFGP